MISLLLLFIRILNFLKQIMPQSVCSRYGLAIGAKVAPAVRTLVWICFPISYPISKLLDYFLGNGHVTLFRRAEVQTLVDFHGNEAGKGGELTHDETIIIAGALQLTQKIAKDTMTPISDTFVVDINAKLDRNLIKLILEKGHSKVPVYYDRPTNIIGLISKGHSHIAAVIRTNDAPVEQQESKTAVDDIVKDVRVDIDGPQEKYIPGKQPILKWKSFPSSSNNSYKGTPRARTKKWDRDILQIDEYPLPKLTEEEEAVGIITMEDVIEEFLQEEIFDETDKSLRGFIT
ncbi:hypothetical protein GIB67_011645 [Kingdonia uniflora]|uniref:CNNM transmembrane domain-containing protein n=1 Tax=Kingdonia uniflora TaxID=39325 RepID=A0A7J7NMK9_9MAGN|nr:hypothetical protein GIB67_011645 [Kingdonia uniflora]